MNTIKPRRRKKTSGTLKKPDVMTPIRVVLVEDRAGSCSWIMPLLEQGRIILLTTVKNAEDAAAAASRYSPDIILIDNAMQRDRQTATDIAESLFSSSGIPAMLIDNSFEGEQCMNDEICSPDALPIIIPPITAREFKRAIIATIEKNRSIIRIRTVEEELRTLKYHTEAIIEHRTARLKRINSQLHQLLHYLEITERKLAMDALEIDFFPNPVIPENEATAVVTIGPDMRIVLINDIASKLLGIPLSEGIGADINSVLLFSDPSFSSQIKTVFQSIIVNDSKGMNIDHTYIKSKDGADHAISISFEPIQGEMEKICGVLISFGDLQEVQRDSCKIRQQYPASLNLMIKGAAHDFNNILSSVLANIQLSMTMIDDRKTALERLSLAEENVQRAHDLCEQMLSYSGNIVSDDGSEGLGDIIKKVSLRIVSGSQARYTYSVAEDVRYMPLDEELIRQIFTYLLEFIAGCIPKNGLIRISADTVISGSPDHKMLSPADYARIRLNTDVLTMPKKDLQGIFLTGLSSAQSVDLAMAESILRKAGGVLYIRPYAEKGIEITLYFPAHCQKLSFDLNETASLPPTDQTRGARKILLMDDEEAILSATSEMLKFLGYEIAISHNGNEALDLYQSAADSGAPFDAVILDITVPGGLGAQETMPKLKAIDPKVRAIISSGYSTNPMMVDYRSFGFISAIIKPYGFRELGQALDMAFNTKLGPFGGA